MRKRRYKEEEIILAQERADFQWYDRQIEALKLQITDLTNMVAELEQLSHTEDDIQFLQVMFRPLTVLPSACPKT